MAQTISGIILVLAVMVSLFMVSVAKKMSKDKIEGTMFESTCPHCGEKIEVELRLEMVSSEEVEVV